MWLNSVSLGWFEVVVVVVMMVLMVMMVVMAVGGCGLYCNSCEDCCEDGGRDLVDGHDVVLPSGHFS
jgi:hypothetical protein